MPPAPDALTLLAYVADAKPAACRGHSLNELFSPAVVASTKHRPLVADVWASKVSPEQLEAIIRENKLPVGTADRLRRLQRVSPPRGNKRKRTCSVEELVQTVGAHALQAVLERQSAPLRPEYGPQISGLGAD